MQGCCSADSLDTRTQYTPLHTAHVVTVVDCLTSQRHATK